MIILGAVLMLKLEILLFDEPSLGLAPNVMADIFIKINEINKQGTIIILVEQNAHMALEICNRAYVLEQGRIALHDGSILANKKLVKQLYLGH